MRLQEYLKNKYPAKKATKEIIISWDNKEEKNAFKQIDGWDLNLSGYPNLEILIINGKCLKSPLKKLNINKCKNLIELSCPNNYLKDLDLSNNLQLEKLDISNNKFSQHSLSFLSNLENLKVVGLGNRGIQSKSKNWNHFSGSLEPLENLTKLEELDIGRGSANIFEDDLDFFIRKKWEELDFSLEEIEKWTEIGLETSEYDFAYYLRGKGFEPSNEVVIRESWKNIHESFSYQKRKLWESQNFNYLKTKEWITAGARVDDAEFVKWLKNIKKETPNWITNYKEDYQTLSERFKRYGLCKNCKHPKTGEQWCKLCNSQRLKQDFSNWTSGSQELDQFIQKYQLEVINKDKLLEWIPYEQFSEVEYLAEGGFGKVFKAKWIFGNIDHWDVKQKQWQREKSFYYEKSNKNKRNSKQNKDQYKKNYKDCREVVLKSLNNSSANTEFLDEVANHKVIDDWFNNIVPCYGLSRDYDGNYLMVMQYMPEGSLRKYLDNNNHKLSLKDKISHLAKIAQGLKDIHSNNLVHRDFHSGNILKGIEQTSCLITDLGLCKPANEINKEDQIYGVMPYVAPEVLRSQPYTQASDVYSFGIIAYEVLSGLPPYYDQEHDIQLALEICQGQRPQFQIKIPQLLEDLIKKCWDTNPKQRPSAIELEKNLRKWYEEITDLKISPEFQKQCREAEEYNKTLLDKIKSLDYKKKMHKKAVYTSRLLPTKEITGILSQTQEFNKLFYIKEENGDLNSCAILSNQFQNISLNNWQNIHSSFTPELIQTWQDLGFTFDQVRDWTNIHFPAEQSQEIQHPEFYAWLRDHKNLTPEQILNDNTIDFETLKSEFHQSQQQTQIIQPTHNN